MTTYAENLRELARLGSVPEDLLRDELIVAADEIDRLQRIIDSRPAINAGLPQTYIEWSHSIYAMEAAHALETPQ